MNETLSYALAALVLPPSSTGLLALVGVCCVARGRARWGVFWVVLSMVTLLVLSMPAVAMVLLRTLEPAPFDHTQKQGLGPQAIVILGGGRQRGALEWGGETVNATSLQRLRYGAVLARELGLPVLLTGGIAGQGARSEAALMHDVLTQALHTEVRWVEGQSLTTRENARLSAGMLQPLGIERIVLVTSASHMARAQRNFSAQGFDVWPAPTDYLGQLPFAWHLLLPSVEGLARSNTALREWLAISRDRFSEKLEKHHAR